MIDSHAHLCSDELYPEIDEILTRAESAGISHIINICTDDITAKRGLQLKKKYPWVLMSAATTPHDVEADGERLFPFMEELARSGELCAVGETGLDYYYWAETKEKQKYYLQKYLHLARSCSLPVVIHCRDAFADFFEILDNNFVPGVLHCFTGTYEEAREVVKRGWYLSLSGIVTYKKSEELRKVAAMVPLEQLLVETDSPYLAPQKWRGKRNEPAYLVETAKVIAEVKGISLEELANFTTFNAKELFGA